MSKVTTGQGSNPEVEVDSEVIAFRSQFEECSPLDQTVREGARRMLQQAIEAEVGEFLLQHDDRRDEKGMFKLAHTAQQGWRKLNGHEKIIPLIQGKKFVNGEMQDAATSSAGRRQSGR